MDDATLHVAINAQLVSFSETYRNAGVSRYTYSLLDGLSHANADLHYTAFVNGHEAAAPPTSLINSRRFMANPRPRLFQPMVSIFRHRSKPSEVRVGSNSEVELADADFRFTPESRHPAVGLGCPFRARTGRADIESIWCAHRTSRAFAPIFASGSTAIASPIDTNQGDQVSTGGCFSNRLTTQ